MTGITQAQAQAHLDEWLAADLAVSKGQSYSIGGRSLTRADAEDIRANIEFWDRQVKRLSRSGIKVFEALRFEDGIQDSQRGRDGPGEPCR